MARSHNTNFQLKITLIIKNQNKLIIQAVRGKKITDRRFLTISHNLDTLLIITIDKFLVKHKLDRLSFKSVEIYGKMKPGALSEMILQTVARALVA